MNWNPLPRNHYLVLLMTAQIGQLWLILLQPDTHLFLNWFLGFTHHRPYEGFFPLVEGGPATSFVDYSAIWYLFYWPTFYGYHAWFIWSWLISTLFLSVVYKNHSQIYTLYILQISFIFTLNSPQDFLPYLFIVIGRVQWKTLPLAIAVKLPLIPPWWYGAANDPATVWRFILYSPVALHAESNWVRYGMLGAAWIIALTLYLHDHKRLPVNSKHIRFLSRLSRSTNEDSPSAIGDRHWSRARRDGSDVHLVRLNGSSGVHLGASPGGHHPAGLRGHHPLRGSEPLPQDRPVASDLRPSSRDEGRKIRPGLRVPNLPLFETIEPGATGK
jgi:hypothetical protein